MPSILIVDDEQSICWGLAKLARSLGHEVHTAASAEEGLRHAQLQPVDLLLLDVRLPGIDGLTALGQFRERIGRAPIIVMTAFGSLDTAVRAVQGGAQEYLLKPFDLAEVRQAIGRALRPVKATAPGPARPEPDAMVGQSQVMQELFKQIALAAASDASLLLCGESGVGKELAARAIHRHSARSAGRFVAVNMAALHESLAESELFGHAQGAYTGAMAARDGLLVQANGGTLFLDEVADIPAALQVKLLRAIEQGEVAPVGADLPVPTDFRVIAATHQDLKQLVRDGRFRHDLYYRLCAFQVAIPPLRHRREDIPQLATHFAAQIGDGRLGLSQEALDELGQRPWHGNVRELRNAIQHAGVLARTGAVLPEHLPPADEALSAHAAASGASLAEASRLRSEELLNDPQYDGAVYETLVREVEGPLFDQALGRHAGEYAPAARALGLHRTTLKKKVEQQDDEAAS